MPAADCHLWIDCVSRRLPADEPTSKNDAIHEQEAAAFIGYRPPLPAQVVSAVGATFQTIRTHASHPCGRTGATFESRSHVEATGTGDGDLALI